jgi:hypothetical protein
MFLSITGSRPGWSILRALCWRSTAMGECRDGEGMFESLAVPRVGGGLQYDAVLVDIMGSLTHESTTVRRLRFFWTQIWGKTCVPNWSG